MGFSRRGYWDGLPCLPPGDLPNPGIEPESLMSPALAGGFFTASATWEDLQLPDQEANLGPLHWEHGHWTTRDISTSWSFPSLSVLLSVSTEPSAILYRDTEIQSLCACVSSSTASPRLTLASSLRIQTHLLTPVRRKTVLCPVWGRSSFCALRNSLHPSHYAC